MPAVYAASGTIYALCFSEAANPGLPTVLEISAGAQRARQVALLDGPGRAVASRRSSSARTPRGRLECMPGSSCKAFRFAGYRAVVSVERHDPPKLVGGEGRQATVTLGAATAAPCLAHRDTGRGTPGDARRGAASPVAGDVAKKGLSFSRQLRRRPPRSPLRPRCRRHRRLRRSRLRHGDELYHGATLTSRRTCPRPPGRAARRRGGAGGPLSSTAALAPAEPSSSTDDGSDDSDDDSSLEDSLPPLPEPDRVSSASTISAVEVGL